MTKICAECEAKNSDKAEWCRKCDCSFEGRPLDVI